MRVGFARLALTLIGGLLLVARPVRADDSLAAVSDQVNRKVVKLFGGGGFQGLASYGTGVLVSPQGHILTVAGHLLLTPDLRVHLWDGRRFEARILFIEPLLDAALIKIDNVEDLPYFDIVRVAKRPPAKAGDAILAFSNEFQIATRDEPVSVQHGVVAAYAKLHGRRGVFDAPYTGEVYIIDAITNNVGAAGGALTTRQGELLGILGKELRNTLSETWINYAVPAPALATFVDKSIKGEYKPIAKAATTEGPAGRHGIILVPNVVERTPPYIEELLPGSPASKAGLRPDDLIVSLDGQQVVSVKGFRDLIAHSRPGATVKVEVRRAGAGTADSDRLLTVDVKLEEPLATVAPKK